MIKVILVYPCHGMTIGTPMYVAKKDWFDKKRHDVFAYKTPEDVGQGNLAFSSMKREWFRYDETNQDLYSVVFEEHANKVNGFNSDPDNVYENIANMKHTIENTVVFGSLMHKADAFLLGLKISEALNLKQIKYPSHVKNLTCWSDSESNPSAYRKIYLRPD